MTDELSVVDLFAGVGGIRLGFERAGRQRDEPLGVKCVYACDIDRYARTTYLRRYPGEGDHLHDDIRTTKDEIPEHFDVLLAGFPCQPFSLAGVSKKNSLGRAHGLADTDRGTLFEEIIDVLETHRPVAFLLENVRHLLGHDGGKTFQEIRRRLSRCADGAYEWRVMSINADRVMPQSRNRVYFIGYLRDFVESAAQRLEMDTTGRSLWIPGENHEPLDGDSFWFPDVTTWSRAFGLADVLHDTRDPRSEEDRQEIERIRQGGYTVGPGTWRTLKRHKAYHADEGNGFGYSVVDPRVDDTTRTLSARYHKDGAEILIRQEPSPGNPEGVPRRLTPRECARLMGFRDEDIPDVDVVSRTQFYRQMGNSVPVDVIEHLAGHMLQRLSLFDALERREFSKRSALAASMVA